MKLHDKQHDALQCLSLEAVKPLAYALAQASCNVLYNNRFEVSMNYKFLVPGLGRLYKENRCTE